MRKTLVLHTGQEPWVAGRPFLRVTWTGLLISRLVRHLKQYASMRSTSVAYRNGIDMTLSTEASFVNRRKY